MIELTPLLAVTITSDTILHLLGRLHPAVVHFPIALVTIAAVLESLQLLRRKPTLHAATPACLIFGALSGMAAVLLGFFLEDAEGGGAAIDLHKWVGIASISTAVIAALFLIRATASERARISLRATVFLGAALVGLTGYLGAEARTSNHLFRNIFDDPKPEVVTSPMHLPTTPTKIEEVKPLASSADFDHDIAPILRDHCLRCHGGEKTKGKLSLKSRSDALKEAANGICLVPGQPDKSTLYTRLIDAEDKMPPAKEKQLTEEQIQRVHQWIKDGAKWPEDLVLK